MPLTNTLRLVGTGGSNRAMEAELKRLARRGIPGFRETKAVRVDEQTLVYPFDEAWAHLAVNYLRTPARVLWDLYQADAQRLEPLYDELLAWMKGESRPWIVDGLGISVRAKDIRAFPASASQIQGTVKNALIAGAEARGIRLFLAQETPDLLFSVRGTNGPLVLSIDLAGRSLHERGWRLERSDAPLRENIAAQILMLARWDPRQEVLLDPMCGSGTFPIEAALMARADPLWVSPRRPDSDHLAPLSLRAPAAGVSMPSLFADAQPVIVGNDIHTPTVAIAKHNLSRANASDRVLLLQGDLRDLDADRLARSARIQRPTAWPEAVDFSRGLMVVNPPYGERLGPLGRRPDVDASEPADAEALKALYASLRELWKKLGPGWRAAFLSANPELEASFPERPILKKPMANASIPAQLLVYGE